MDRKAIVTGGSKGIGLEIVLSLLREGVEVYYLCRTQGPSKEQICELTQAEPYMVHWIACDLNNSEELEKTLDTILEKERKIDILVNNAGITKDGLIMRMSDQQWDEVLKVNLTSAFITCRKVGRQMASNRGGAIVNIASVVGITGNAGQTNYAASKAGLIGFSKSLAKELASRSVRVNVVAPGFIATDMSAVLPDNVKESINLQIPLKRMGEAKEVANVVTFLCSDLASYITGEVIKVDGGMVM
ncbi:MAG: 3-oxoacyl-[acyl-carrier-protein] reductase [Sphaerochaetaceae bacterium]